jgi:hypothetical protein
MGPQAHFSDPVKCGRSSVATALLHPAARWPSTRTSRATNGRRGGARFGEPSPARRGRAPLTLRDRGRWSRARRSRARPPSWRRRRPSPRARRTRGAPRRSARRAPPPPRAASAKLGRLPFAVSAISVNCETTRTEPATSSTERSNRPSSSGKIRSRATLAASRAACSSPSPRATPRSTQRPRPISPPGPTRARETRCTTARTPRS